MVERNKNLYMSQSRKAIDSMERDSIKIQSAYEDIDENLSSRFRRYDYEIEI